VVIEEVLVDGRPVNPRPLLTMPSSAQTLAIDFTAMSLIAPESIRFRYRLEGLEEDWVAADARRTAYYSKLPPGRYQFRVIASSADGVWGDAGATLALAVAPNWYETALFRGGVVVMLALIGPLVYRARVAHLVAQKASLEHVVAQRTAELAEANARLLRLADEDGLTGLLNRRAFDAALDEECRRAARANAPLALLLIDIDAFKAYNDHFGHQAGDVCLRAVSDAVRHAHRRAGEVVARYGGEELGVILPGASPAAAAEMGEQVRRAVERLALPHPGSPAAPVVTISVGVASCGADVACSDEALVAAADRALYRAKQDGRNRVAVDGAAR
jgi:diguanylate cyclase (GGDEF)-like protein